MPADTSVKYFHSSMVGAPTLNGTAGALIAVLDACLVNGFSAGTVDTVVIAGGVGTVTRSAGHPFEVDTVAEISGATVTGGSINGQHKVLSITSTTWTFDATGIADQTATGTISAKLAAAGWGKPFSGTNLAAYRSADVTGTRLYLRIDDTNVNNARAVGYESMSDINTGTGPFPTTTQVSGGLYWPKSNTTSPSNARQWVLWCDGKTFHMAVNWNNSTTEANFGLNISFGDWNRAGTVDSYNCGILGSPSTLTNNTPGSAGADYELSGIDSTLGRFFSPRPYSGIGSAQALIRSFVGIGTTGISAGTYSGGSASGMSAFPNPTDGGLYVSQIMLNTSNTSSVGVFRGVIPGVYGVPQFVGPSVFTHRAKIDSIANLSGRKLMAINSNNGVSFVDITGPWA